MVVKVGSSLVTNDGRGLDLEAISRWAAQVARLRELGKQVLLVSSGAIAEGMQRLGWSHRPQQIHELQAAAAVGQMGLARAYETHFERHGVRTAQVLLTHADLADRPRYLNARSTLFTLLELGVVPVINENDTVVTDEIKFGDNDTLGALVTNLVEADVFVILTDQAGLFSADPRRDRGRDADRRCDGRRRRARGDGGRHRKRDLAGGMLTKVLAAKRAARSGAHTVIASGREPDVLLRLADGEMIGTQLDGGDRRADRAQAVAGRSSSAQRARVVVDAGAARALAVRRQEPAADRCRRRPGRVPARRRGRVPGSDGPRDRARARQLLQRADKADRCASRPARSRRCSGSSRNPNSSTATIWC